MTGVREQKPLWPWILGGVVVLIGLAALGVVVAGMGVAGVLVRQQSSAADRMRERMAAEQRAQQEMMRAEQARHQLEMERAAQQQALQAERAHAESEAEVAVGSVRGRIELEAGDAVGGTGEFDSSVVVRTIRTRARAVQTCYERRLRLSPALTGRVTVTFTIQEDGSVSAARATENTSGDQGLADCVLDTVQRLRFNPGPEGGSVQYSYPFAFSPSS